MGALSKSLCSWRDSLRARGSKVAPGLHIHVPDPRPALPSLVSTGTGTITKSEQKAEEFRALIELPRCLRGGNFPKNADFQRPLAVDVFLLLVFQEFCTTSRLLLLTIGQMVLVAMKGVVCEGE